MNLQFFLHFRCSKHCWTIRIKCKKVYERALREILPHKKREKEGGREENELKMSSEQVGPFVRVKEAAKGGVKKRLERERERNR